VYHSKANLIWPDCPFNDLQKCANSWIRMTTDEPPFILDSGQLIGRAVLTNQLSSGSSQFGGLFDRLKQQIEQRLR
jgi:hypothetical protein